MLEFQHRKCHDGPRPNFGWRGVARGNARSLYHIIRIFTTHLFRKSSVGVPTKNDPRKLSNPVQTVKIIRTDIKLGRSRLVPRNPHYLGS